MKTERIDGQDGRTYKITLPSGECVEYPSVTTVLSALNKPYLVPWASKCAVEYVKQHLPKDRVLTETELDDLLKAAKSQHNWIKEEASVLGLQAHDLVEQHLKTGIPPDLDTVEMLDPRVRLGVEKHRAWWEEHGFEPVAVEMVVYHEGIRVAGTLDAVAVNERGRLCLVDLKTSNHYSKEYALQAVAYKYAYELMTSSMIDEIYIVRVGKDDADIEVVEIPSARHPLLFKRFKAMREVYEWTLDEKEFAKQLAEEKKRAAKAAKDAAALASNNNKAITKRQAVTRLRPI